MKMNPDRWHVKISIGNVLAPVDDDERQLVIDRLRLLSDARVSIGEQDMEISQIAGALGYQGGALVWRRSRSVTLRLLPEPQAPAYRFPQGWCPSYPISTDIGNKHSRG